MDLPSSWAACRLEECIEFALGGDWGSDPQSAVDGTELALCIRGSELRAWSETKGRTAAVRRIDSGSLQKRRLAYGDILIEISGGGPEQPVGRAVMIDEEVLSFRPDLSKVCTNFFRMARPRKEIDPRFLAAYLQHLYAAGKTKDIQAGSNNLRNLKFPAYLAIEVPIAPAAEQHRIVAKIEELFSELDKALESLMLARAQLKTYRQTLLKAAFDGQLSVSRHEERNSWRDTRLGDEIIFLTSGSRGLGDYYSDAGDIFIRAQNLKHDRLDLADIAYVRLPSEGTEGLRTRVQQGDVLITITGANVTKTGIVNSDIGTAYVSQHVALRPSAAA